MRLNRTLPPAASPIYPKDIISGLKGLVHGQRELERFKKELKTYFGIKHCFLLSSGKAALTLVLRALSDMHPHRDEVLIPAFTCYSVPSAIVRAGLKVRLCDINPDTLDFDFDQLSKILNKPNEPNEPNEPNKPNEPNEPNEPNQPFSRLLAVIPVHLFGLPSDINRLRELISDPEVNIVEDSAQAMGGEWNGKNLGTLGDISFFSLGRGKALSTVEGGIVLTNREDIAKRIMARLSRISDYSLIDMMKLVIKSILLNIFLHPGLYWVPKSIPFLRLGATIYDSTFNITKMSPYQAGLANGWEDKLQRLKVDRKKNSKNWLSSLKSGYIHHYCSNSSNLPNLIRYPIRFDNNALRERIVQQSHRLGLGIMYTYPDSIDHIKEITSHFKGKYFPVANKISKNLITLPIHPFVSQNDRSQITASISQQTQQTQ